MEVTKVSGNRVYELDSKPIFDVLAHYFGKNILDDLPQSVIEFPLIKTADGVDIARAPVAKLEDSLVYAGNFELGDKVRFGVVDSNFAMIEDDKRELIKPEVIWIYSCFGRKVMLGSSLEREFEIFSPIAPTSGFFTYGEFYKMQDEPQMFNLTTTIFALSEQVDVVTIPLPEVKSDYKADVITNLTHFTNSVVSELEQIVRSLDVYKLALDSNSIVSKTDPKGIITYVNELFEKVSGYSKEELIGSPHNIIRHPETPSSVFKEMWETIKSKKIWKGILKNKTKTGDDYYVDTTVIPILDDNREIVEFIATRNDLTKIIKQQQQIERHEIDALTGLPSRAKFFDNIAQMSSPIVALLNIDDFRKINHFYGFEVGNALLVEFAQN